MQRSAPVMPSMVILNDKEITRLCKEAGMIAPWVPQEHRPGVISYGVTSFGYDMRISNQWATYHPGTLIDPKNELSTAIQPVHAEYYDIAPGAFVLARSHEVWRIPDDVLSIVVGKSTYARCGLIVNCTPMEPGWMGTLTIELHNASQHTIRVHAYEGIAQAVFFRGERPKITYKDKRGKYQGQTDVTPALVK